MGYPRYRGSTVKEQALVHRLEGISPLDYVEGVREHGRENLDNSLRTEMAELYEDLRPLLHQDRLSPRSRAVLRLVEPVLQSEWKLLNAPDPEPEAGQPWTLPLERRGMRYNSYANLRVLNQVLGVNRHTTDGAIESSAWRVIAYLCASWAAFEERSLAGTETWNQDGCPVDEILVERCDRLRALARRASGAEPPPRVRPAPPPARWTDYLSDPDGRLRLEFLTALPQTRKHEEVIFLRTIHLTESCMWAVLGRVMTAIEWIRREQWESARRSLHRATTLARVLNEVFEIMKTMTVESFLSFRANTGDSSAVQSTANHLLHVFMQGVDPAKAKAIQSAPENEYLLRYINRFFLPLSRAVETIPTDDPDGRAVLAEARLIDQELLRWRSSHYGVARRYVPNDSMGTGGTAGATYLKEFYANRIFTKTGRFAHPKAVVSPLDSTLPIDRGRARPVFSWQN